MITDQHIKDWFRNHVPTHETLSSTVERLKFRNPTSGIYHVNFLRDCSTLFVHGDIGEAVYQWSGTDHELGWMANCDLGYWHSKCVASENGARPKEFSFQKAESDIDDLINECDKETRDAWTDLGGERHLREGGIEWDCWVFDNGYDVFGSDYGELLSGIGMVIPVRIRAHLIGLQEAVGRMGAQA